ncbi:hypothetical protein SSX86_001037 [Deinandra increscens subsp. villosa]|uniref:threonine ammonia-lyase n=1 Tax=Deinandra increscens subsp. villosa TaxID=3103831 RepID=A0AAP0HC63_9ASTR
MMKICAVPTATLSASYPHSKNTTPPRNVVLNARSWCTTSRSNIFQGHNTMAWNKSKKAIAAKVTRAAPEGEVGSILDTVTETFDQTKDVVTEKAHDAAEKTSELSGEAATIGKQAVVDSNDYVADKAKAVADATTEKTKEGNDFVAEKGRQAGDKVSEMKDFTAEKAKEGNDFLAEKGREAADKVRIIGVEPADANAMALSLHHGQRVMLDQVGGFADGVAVKEVGSETFRLCRELIDGVVLVSRDAICASIKDMFEEKRSILEPAGALSLAGAEAYCKFYNLKDINVVAITSGANMNFDRLRLVTELANVGRQREAVLATSMPEEPGSFKQFAELVGKMNITEFKYRYEENKQALVFVGLHTKFELQAMVERMESYNLKTTDFTNNDMVKDHLRHLMGGRTNVENELLCRFVFPERPGALMKFLHAFSPRWNISLFHYRAQGEAGANVLVGIQVSSNELDEFRYHANNLGFDYELEMNNEAFRLLMR